jgi:hypothetical protein
MRIDAAIPQFEIRNPQFMLLRASLSSLRAYTARFSLSFRGAFPDSNDIDD